MELEQRIYNGDRAREVLENPAFAQAFEQIDQEFYEQWKTSPIRDHEGREELFRMQTLLGKLRLTLEATMTDGKLARQHLDHMQKLAAKDRAQGIDTTGWTSPIV